LLRQVRQRYPELLMVLMADHFPFSPDEAASLEIHRYLRKPIYLDEVEFALRGLCPECARCKHRRGEPQYGIKRQPSLQTLRGITPF
jgi:hypothetical protein